MPSAQKVHFREAEVSCGCEGRGRAVWCSRHGRSPTHITSASSRRLTCDVPTASPSHHRTLPVPAGEASSNAGSLHHQEQPSRGWDQPVAHPHRVPVYPSRSEPRCPQQPPAHGRLHDLPPFPASPLMFPGMTSYMKSHTGALI